MKISVIVPVYNVESYVEACLRSILRQTFRDLEILVVDDGSTDSSGEICERLSREDERIHVFHQENGGLSAARNTGLQAASGEFVAPVDSDDLLSPAYMEKLLNACLQNHAQASVCDCRGFTEDREWEAAAGEQKDCREEKSVQTFSSAECLEHMYHPISSGMSFTAWGKLYQRSLFTEKKLEYPVGKIHEDQFVTYQLLDAAERIAYVPEELYWYRTRSGSIMHRKFDRRRLDLMEATRGQCLYFLEKGENNLASLAVNNHIRTEFSLLACAREGADAETGDLEAELRTALKKDCRRFLPGAELPILKKWIFYLAAELPAGFIVEKLRMF